jgi:hypothetical protein
MPPPDIFLKIGSVTLTSLSRTGGFDGLVAMARGKTPDPIPNSAVKTLSADGTASQGVGE